MGKCDDFQDLLLDLLYGLLEADEEQRLRAHMTECPACHTALATAEGERNLLAHAAHVCGRIAPFEMPVESGSTADTSFRTVIPVSPVAVVPLPRKRRKIARVLGWSAAAAVLLVVGGLWMGQQHGLQTRRTELAQARKQIEDVDARFAVARQTLEEKQAKVSTEVQSQFTHLHVVGPAQHEADAPSPLRISSRDLAGKPLPALVTTRLIAPDSGKELFKETLPSNGDLVMSLPAGIQGSGRAKLLVQAHAGQASAEIEETIRLEKPAYITHLALNKSVYQPGEAILLRTLTLERFSLKPPTEKIALTYALGNAQGQTIAQFADSVGPGGISGGELSLPANLSSGVYVLRVAGAGPNVRLLPRERRLEVVRDVPPEFHFDRDRYKPGDTVTAQFKGRRQVDGAPIANQQVKVQAMIDGKPVGVNGSAPGKPAQLRTDAFGNAPIQLKLPAPIEQGNALLEAQIEEGSRAEKVVQNIPVIPSSLTVDLYPEGGDLVANVPNRIYYRVRTPLGAPVDPEGYGIVLSDKDGILASERRQGIGAFTFTPKVNEKYTLCVTSSKKTLKESDDAFQSLKIQPDGVALHVTDVVGKEGEPLRLELHNAGAPRKLGILATCRGRIVADEFVSMPKGTKKLRLVPVAGSRGIIRLTLFDASGGSLIPLAERLLYRAPAERLVVSIPNLKKSYANGTRQDWQVQTLDEKGNKAPAWMLAAVLDENAMRPADVQAPSLPAHFYLVSELHQPEDLDDADVLLADTAEARKALDMFLGTQGWRRFVRPERAELTLAKDRDRAESPPALFSRENDSPASLLSQSQARAAKMLDQLRVAAAKERLLLEGEKKQHVQEARLLAAELERFEDLPAAYFRLGIGVAALGSLVAGGIFLLVGLVRIVRRSASPTGAFAAAVGSLLACVALFAGAGSLPSPQRNRAEDVLATVPPSILPALPEPKVAEAKLASVTPAPLPASGLFALAQKAQAAEAESGPASTTSRGGVNMLAKRDQAQADKAGRGPELSRSSIQERFLQTPKSKAAGMPAGQAAMAPAAPAATKPAFKKADAEAKKPLTYQYPNFSFLREYAYLNSSHSGKSADVVLWYPALFAKDGSARLSFDLPRNATSYRILIYGNTSTGRLGAFQGKVQAR
jgi:hypothetical protein